MTTTEILKKKSRLIKVIGGGLLLVSFIVQNFAYDYWDKKADEYYNVNKDFSEMNRSSLLYLNLYFNTKFDNDTLEAVIKQQYINMAAQKQALGQTIEIVTRDMEKQDKIDLCNSLIQKAKTVSDYTSYLDYISFSNQRDTYKPKDSMDRVQNINNKRDKFRYIFLFSYVIGSILLLFGLKYE